MHTLGVTMQREPSTTGSDGRGPMRRVMIRTAAAHPVAAVMAAISLALVGHAAWVIVAIHVADYQLRVRLADVARSESYAWSTELYTRRALGAIAGTGFGALVHPRDVRVEMDGRYCRIRVEYTRAVTLFPGVAPTFRFAHDVREAQF